MSKPKLKELEKSIDSNTLNEKAVFKPLDIQVMTEADALLLIRSILKKEEKETELKDLAKTLGYLPLALTQASTHIKETGTSIAVYLKRYQQYAVKLLSEGLSGGEKSLPIATTCNLTFETIAKEALDNKEPPLALELLIVSAYLAPDNIPRPLLLTWLKEAYPQLESPELVLGKSLSQLHRYSLISLGENSIGVHSLVQTIIRFKHQEAKNLALLVEIPSFTPVWFNRLLVAVNNEFNRETKVLEDEVRERGLLPHLQCLEGYAKLHLKEPSKEIGNLLHSIGCVFERQGAAKLAVQYYNQALKIQEAHYDKEHPHVATILTNLGNAYGALGDSKQNKELLERALKIKEAHYGKEHPELAKTLTYLGNAYVASGDSEQSRELLERALKIKEVHCGKDHPEVGITLTNLGNAYDTLGDSKQSKELLERALKILETHYGKEHPIVSPTLTNLGIAYGSLGDSQQCKEFLERALNIDEAHYGKNHPEVAKTLTNLGNAYGALGDSIQSKELLERSLKIKEAHYGKEHPEVAMTLYNLAVVNHNLKNNELAYSLAERSYQTYLKAYGEQHNDTKDAYNLRKQYRALASKPSAKKPQVFTFSAVTNKTKLAAVNKEKLNEPQNSNPRS